MVGLMAKLGRGKKMGRRPMKKKGAAGGRGGGGGGGGRWADPVTGNTPASPETIGDGFFYKLQKAQEMKDPLSGSEQGPERDQIGHGPRPRVRGDVLACRHVAA